MTEIRDELWLRSPVGVLQVPGVLLTWCEWTLAENTFHVLRASGPLETEEGVSPGLILLDPDLLVPHARFEVHRFLNGFPLGIEGDTQFLLVWWDVGEDDQGAATWNIEAWSPEYVALVYRLVDSFASLEGDVNPLTTKSGPGDDVIKALMAENASPSAALAARRVAELSIDGNLSAALSINKSCAWDQLLGVLSDIAADVASQGTWLSFGMVASGTGTGFAFRTWTGQRGRDHSAGSKDEVVVSREMGNLRSGRVSFDHRLEYTAVRALGKSEGRARETVRVEDTARSAVSPWGYREVKIETQAETTATLTADANAALQRGRPFRGFTGKMIDSDYARYGDRVKFADLVTARDYGRSFTCRLSTVKGRWSKEGEVLDIDLVGSEVA